MQKQHQQQEQLQILSRQKQQLETRPFAHLEANEDRAEQRLRLAATPVAKAAAVFATPLTSATQKRRPLSISSISSAASSNSSGSSAFSSASSGIHSSLTRNGSLNYGSDYKRCSYLASIESLNNSSITSSSQDHHRDSGSVGGLSIEDALKNLNLAGYDDGSGRASTPASGIHQGREFGSGQTPIGKISRINRSLHASLRYDKNTAHRIHLMANSRGLVRRQSINQSSSIDETSDLAPSRAGSSSISRNNSSTSSDSSHIRQLSILNASNRVPRSPRLDKNYLVTEIIDTERTYVNDLEQIVTGYICYLRNVLKQHKYQDQQSRNNKTDTSAHNPRQQDTRKNGSSTDSMVNTDGQKGEFVSGKETNDDSEAIDEIKPTDNSNIQPTEEYDDKSLSVFDDDTTSAIHESVDDYYDAEEVDQDQAAIVMMQHVEYQNAKPPQDDSITHATSDSAISACLAKSTITSTTTATDSTRPISSRRVSNGGAPANDILPASSNHDGAIMTANHIKNLFSNLEEIYKFNKDLLFRLEECYLNPGSVAECFVENASGFDVYTHYCTMYPQVVSTLTELMANQSSAQLLRERQNELNQSLPLGAYLLKPVQRILKYHILFQRLIKLTTDDETVNEEDRQLISEAFSVMTSIACHINDMKKKHEHAVRVQEVQGLLSGWEGPDLTTLGELILEDTFKLYNRPKSSRHLFLFDNVLLMTKKKRDGSLCYKGHIACSNLMLIEKIEGQPLVFNTVPFDNPKALSAFQAKHLDKKRDWCLQMKELIIKSYEVKIPGHVKDILMSLTNSATASSTDQTDCHESGRAIRAPNYLEKKNKKAKLEKKK